MSWWAADGNTSDLLGANNPSASNAVSFVSGEVGTGFTLGPGGYIDVPASTSLANQQFTWSAWVRPDGPGPNSDSFGSVIVGQNIDNTHVSAQLLWRATDNHFLFLFGDISSEQIVSTDAFAPGQFYLVTGTYNGSTFSLYVNGKLEGQLAEAKTISYPPSTWTIGSTDAALRGTFPRTWNGVIDEVQAFNRALTQSEIQAIYTAASAGECRGQPALFSIVPNSGSQGQQNLSVALTGQFTNWAQGTTTASFGAGITVASLAVNAATGATAVLNIDPATPVGASAVTLTTGTEIDTLANGFSVAASTTGTPALASVNPNSGRQGQQNLS
ncbi:MAG: LamG domain-containing protein, partial [Terriglobia bacterium]